MIDLALKLDEEEEPLNRGKKREAKKKELSNSFLVFYASSRR